MTSLTGGGLLTSNPEPFDDQFVQRYLEVFVHDFDRHGLQRIRDGKTWYRNNLPGGIGLREVRASLEGERTYAGYPVDREGMSKWTVFDLDLPHAIRTEIENTTDPDFKDKQEAYAWTVIYEMGRLLKNKISHLLGESPITLKSGSKGLHVYVLWDKPIPVKNAADFGALLKFLLDKDHRDEGLEFLSVETYPCESDVSAVGTDHLPHLVKLPLAHHLKTGNIASFTNLRTQEDLPPDVLWLITRVKGEDLEALLTDYADELNEALRTAGGSPGSPNTQAVHHAEPYVRLNRPGGPQELLSRCDALGGLVRLAEEKHHLDHRQRFQLACSLLAFGKGAGEAAVHEILEMCSDYSFNYTQSQLNHALMRAYRSPLCKTLQKDGICPYKEGTWCEAVGDFRTPLGVLPWRREPVNTLTRQRLRKVRNDELSASAAANTIPTATIDQIRAEIPEAIDRYLEDPEGRIFVLKIDPGVGKTTTVGHHLANRGLGDKPFRIFWAAQRHDMFDSVYPLFFNIQAIQPKISDRKDLKTNVPVQQCVNPYLSPYLKIMRKKAWSRYESKRVCARCLYMKGQDCPYFEQWKYPHHIFAPQQHLVSKRLQENSLGVQAILIDESPANVFTNQLEVTIPMVDAIISFIDARPIHRGHLMISILEAVKRVMNSADENIWGYSFFMLLERTLSEMDPSGQILQVDLAQDFTSPLLHSLIKELDQSDFWQDWDDAFFRTSIEEMPHRWFSVFFSLVEKEKLLFGTPYTSLLFVRVTPDEKGYYEPTLVITEALTFKDQSTPIIVLDGAPNLREYERIFGREIVLFERHLALENHVYQLKTGEYTKSTLRGTSQRNQVTRDRLLRIVAEIIKRGHCTLVAGAKEIIEQHVAPYLKREVRSDQYRLAYYWGFRGTNEFEACDQVVLLGAANPNFEELVHQHSGAFSEGDTLDPTLDAIWQRYEGLDLEVKVSGYADTRLNELLLYHRNHEMGQTIHRIRPLQNPSKSIWILSDIPIPGIPPTHLMTVEEMAGHLGLTNPSPQQKGALGHLVQVATELLEDPGWFNRKTLADASRIAVRTVAKHIGSVHEILGLTRSGHRYTHPDETESVHDPLIKI